MASLTYETKSRVGYRVRVYGLDKKRYSIWLGDVSAERAKECAEHIEAIIRHRTDWAQVPEQSLEWLTGQPKSIKQKLAPVVRGTTIRQAVIESVGSAHGDRKTVERYEYNLGLLLDSIGDRPVESVTHAELQHIMDALPFAVSTKRLIVSHWKRFFQDACRQQLTPNDTSAQLVACRKVWTYFVATVGHPRRVKIGYATNVRARFSAIQSGCPVKLVLLGVLEGNHESALHDRFASYHHHGEWFTLSSEIENYITQNANSQ